jgi:microcystin-dependent protein
MANPFIGEIRIAGFGAPPRGWALCNGQLLPINQNQALFSILGTTYGGNGITNFALPDLQGRVPVHFGGGVQLGQSAGEAAHALTAQEMPAHSHRLLASSDFANSSVPAGAVPAAKGRGGRDIYAPGGSAPVSCHPAAINASGSGAAHENMQPYLTLNFIIALQGIFPARN